MNNKKISILIILLIFIITVLSVVYYFRYFKKDILLNKNEEPDKVVEKVQPKKLQIYQGFERPIAISIDNEKPAWPHSGLQDAYMIYEMIIEGGESRMLALFKNKTTSKIGPIRSARHYFVHYAMENDAIFAHFGWSPKAESTINKYKVNNINGLYDEYYWRVGGGYHNAFSSINNIKETANDKKYILSGNDNPIYKYSIEEYNFKEGVEITNLKIKYSDLHNVSYVYDKNDKVFYRSMRGIKDIDRETKKQYYAKNIVIMYVKNYNLPDVETKGRQELANIGMGEGYYLTNGKYIKITWKKETEKSRTLWLDENGEEIILNDGLTFVQLAPSAYKVDFTLPVVDKNINLQ
ncbi:MAG: DUF3048 domain-containing protein [Clostridia bacterium]